MITITFDETAKPFIMDVLGIKDIKPEDFGGFVNGKVFKNDICSLIEMSDEMK